MLNLPIYPKTEVIIIGYIYIIENLINNKKYVGQTKNPEYRWKRHIHDDIHIPSLIIGRAFIKYGIENFDFKIIEECQDDEMSDREKFWIKQLRTYIKDPECHGYNMTPGGEKLYGQDNPFYNKKHTNETKTKLSMNAKNRIGSKNPFYGKHHSERAKQKISTANTGKKKSEEMKQAISERMLPNNPFKGKHHSKETKIKISESVKGRIPYNAKQWIATRDAKVLSFPSIGKVMQWIIENDLVNETNFTMAKLKNRLKKSEQNNTEFIGYYWKKSVETIESMDDNPEVSRVGFEMDAKPKREDVE